MRNVIGCFLEMAINGVTAHVTVEYVVIVDPPVDVYLAVYAVNVGEMHWMLLAAHVPTATVSVVDSLSLASSWRYIDKWR